MKAAPENKQLAPTTSQRYFRLLSPKGKHHVHSASPGLPSPAEKLDEANEAPVSRQLRVLRAAAGITLFGIAFVVGGNMVANDFNKTPTIPVMPTVHEFARYGLDMHNQGYGHTSEGGKILTITLPTSSFGTATLTIESSSTEKQPGSRGRFEPNPIDVTSLTTQGQLANGEISTNFTRDSKGNWSVTYCAPNEDDLPQTTVTSSQEGATITEITTANSETQMIAGSDMATKNLQQAILTTSQIGSALNQTAMAPFYEWPILEQVA